MDFIYEDLLNTLSLLSTTSFTQLERPNSANNDDAEPYGNILDGLEFYDKTKLTNNYTPFMYNSTSKTPFIMFKKQDVYSIRLLKCLFHLLLREQYFNKTSIANQLKLKMNKHTEPFPYNRYRINKISNHYLPVFVNHILPNKPSIDWDYVLHLYKIDSKEPCALKKEDLIYHTNKILLEWYSSNNFIKYNTTLQEFIEITKPIFLVGNLTNLPKWVYVHYKGTLKRKRNENVTFSERSKIEHLINSGMWDDWRFVAAKLETKEIYVLKRCYKRKIEGGKGTGCKATFSNILSICIIRKCKPFINNQSLSEDFLKKFNCVEIRRITESPLYQRIETVLNNIFNF